VNTRRQQTYKEGTYVAATTEDRDYSGLPNKAVSAADGIDYAYRDTGGGASGTLPLVLFQHFRGNLDSWDPALMDALAAGRRVITFDYAGVGGSTGTTASTVEEMAREAIAFIAALDLGQVDLLGFLHRQLRRPGGHADPTRDRPAGSAGLLGAAGRGRQAWLGP
jgi:hypothetical protein